MAKAGKLSIAEQKFILNNYEKMSAQELATHVKKSLVVIEDFIEYKIPILKRKKDVKKAEVEKAFVKQDLIATESWKRLKEEFSDSELAYFQESYTKLMAQFKNDVFASEETQIFQVVKFEILMNRNLRDRRKCLLDIEKLEQVQNSLLSRLQVNPDKLTKEDKAYLVTLDAQLAGLRSAEQSKTSEYVKLQERHDALLKSLKAIRQQRITQIENSKTSFVDIIKMLQERDMQEREGRQMELVKLAGEAAYKQLGKPIQYDNGDYDSPILSAETVLEKNDAETGPDEAESS